jgi:hypothetical protein
MTLAEAEEYTKNSYYSGRVLYHGTNPAGAASIANIGVNPARFIRGFLGEGFYLTNREERANDFSSDENGNPRLGPILRIMWLVSGLLVYVIFGLPFWEAMLVGAVITPSDPVVSTSVVTGKVAEENLPERIRNSLSTESVANDGLAYPFVLLPILILTKTPTEALSEWLIRVL